MRKWAFRTLIALGVTWGVVYVITPPRYVAEQFQIRPNWISARIGGIFAIVFFALLLLDLLRMSAMCGDRTLRTGGVISLVTGLFDGLFAARLWFAFVSLLLAPIGIPAALVTLRRLTLRRVTREGKGHSIANLLGLILNLVALGDFASQVNYSHL